MEQLHFGNHSTHSPETFLALFLDCLKKMEKEEPQPKKQLPNKFRNKVTHPLFGSWKRLSKKLKEDWIDTQASFLQEVRKLQSQLKRSKHDTSRKYTVANGQIDAKLREKIDNGHFILSEIFYNVLTQEDWYKHKQAREKRKEKAKEAKSTQTGESKLPTQYSIQNGQLGNLPP